MEAWYCWGLVLFLGMKEAEDEKMRPVGFGKKGVGFYGAAAVMLVGIRRGSWQLGSLIG